jgi:hypothetical protein
MKIQTSTNYNREHITKNIQELVKEEARKLDLFENKKVAYVTRNNSFEIEVWPKLRRIFKGPIISDRYVIKISLEFDGSELNDFNMYVRSKDYFSYAKTIAEEFEKQSTTGKYGKKSIEAMIKTDFGIEELEDKLEEKPTEENKDIFKN